MTIGIIDWEPPHEVYKHYKDKTLAELMELHDASTEAMDNGDEKIVNAYDYENTRLEIASRLHLIPLDVANACLEAELIVLSRRIDELEAIAKKHRHKTIGGLYTEKPAW